MVSISSIVDSVSPLSPSDSDEQPLKSTVPKSSAASNILFIVSPPECLVLISTYKYIILYKYDIVNSTYKYYKKGGSYMYFQRLRDLREDMDMTQTQISELLGIKQTVYSRYERGYQTIPVEHLIRLADFYKVSTDYILGRTLTKKMYPKKR